MPVPLAAHFAGTEISANTTATLSPQKNVFLEKDSMANALKYMIDEKGDRTSVLVPLKTWEKINQEYAKLQHKLKILTGIKEGLHEVKEAGKSGKKLQTLKEFLRESNS